MNETTTNLEVFKALSQDDVNKLIMHMQTKSFESDTLLMKFVKEHIDNLLSIITKIVNLPLINGIFVKDWKVAIFTTAS